ncbi:MaoC family dehydratase [Microvirga flavescens]|uniref:MaoC family dehydratase n=1 Tax=Microvirga flavescens TaxID=2249811 RepID=UPI000DD9256D|nr:MaoC family dehydratase [Microvirga flavescens]
MSPDLSIPGRPSSIVAGDALPVLSRQITQQMIDDYANASGDFNPIHVDPEFARTGPFGRTIAHGLMTLAFAAQMLNAWSEGTFDECGEIDVAFIGPVFAGDVLTISGVVEEILSHEGRAAARVRLKCEAGERQVLAGTAMQPLESIGKV